MKKLLFLFILINSVAYGRHSIQSGSDTIKAQYQGGETELFQFIAANISYPQWPKEECIGGVVYVSFTILADGQIDNITIKRAVGFGLDEEAIRVIKLTNNKWEPAKVDGNTFSSTMLIPIKFLMKGCKQPTGKKLDQLKEKYAEFKK